MGNLSMNLQTFQAPTMAEALGQVKRAMGSEAVILHTRTYHMRYCFGLRRREIVEITAGRGLGVKPAAKMKQPVFVSAPETAPAAPVNPIANGQALLGSAVAGNAAIIGITTEVANLKSM